MSREKIQGFVAHLWSKSGQNDAYKPDADRRDFTSSSDEAGGWCVATVARTCCQKVKHPQISFFIFIIDLHRRTVNSRLHAYDY